MGSGLTLPANWKIHHVSNPTWSAASSTLTQQASAGSPVTGGTYNWGSTATERAPGVMSSGSFSSPSSLLAWYQNAHATDQIYSLDVSYDLERYRQNTAAASVQFYYSTDGSTWTAVPAGDIAAASLPTGTNTYGFNPPNLVVSVGTFTITGLSVQPGEDLYLRWNLNTTGSNSQGIGIDNVTVRPDFCLPASITSQPANAGICTGDNTSFSVTASGGVITYQWQVSTNGGVTWTNLIDDATYSGSQLSLLNVTAAAVSMNNYRYRCIVTMAGCSTYTRPAVLNVLSNPAFTLQPANVTAPVGSNATFFVNATSAATYQWQLSTDGGATWSNLANTPPYSGINTPSMTVSGINAGMSGYRYRCVIAGCSLTANSNAATLTIGAAAGTVLLPGDLVFIGYDAKVGTGAGCTVNAGTDKYYVLNLVDLAPNTNFKIVNSRFESGAAANVRTNKWYSASSAAYYDPAYISITWNGAFTIPKGSVLAFTSSTLVPSTVTEATVNGTNYLPSFVITAQGSCNISSSDPDQIYLVQGTFTAFGTPGNSGYYNLFNGHVLFGLSNFADWVPLTSACSDGSAGADRVSRLPEEIECFNLSSVSNREVFYYLNFSNHAGTRRQLLLDIMTLANWGQPASTSCLDIAEDYSGVTLAAIGKPFTINPGNAAGTWIGDLNVDWFNCRNWEGLTVPDAGMDVTVSSLAARDCQVDVINFAPTAAKYSNLAECKNITVSDRKLIVEGNSANVLAVGGFLRIMTTGQLDMDDGNSLTTDGRIYLSGNWINQVGDAAFSEGNGTVYFQGNANQSVSTALGLETFHAVSLTNALGMKIFNAVDITGSFDMLNGIITSSDTINDILTFRDNAVVTNASNASFTAGKVSKVGNESFTFPVGETGTGYRPVSISAPGMVTDRFTAEYIRGNASLLGPVTALGLNHVSSCEYWILDRDIGSSVVDITATFDNTSCGVTSLPELVIAHFDALVSMTWENYGTAGSATGTVAAGTVTWYTVNTFSPFALGSLSSGNPLPVEWLSFTAAADGDEALLRWTTASEVNNDHFDVLRSADAMQFEKVGEVRGAGNSAAANNYAFTDSPPPAATWYYRLKQVDYDGRESLSRVLAVSFRRSGVAATVIGPNPATDYVELRAFSSSAPEYVLWNSLGEMVRTGRLIPAGAGSNWRLDGLGAFPSGMYFLEVRTGGEVSRHRLLVGKD